MGEDDFLPPGDGDGVRRRVVVDSAGPPRVMTVAEDSVPEPGEGEVLVRVAAAGVNVVDLYQRSGTYGVPYPWSPGFEGGGVVLRTGGGVTGVRAGDRVAWAGAPGSYATHAVVPAQRLVPVPDALSLEDAAAVLVQGMTAHFLLSDVAPLAAGDVCLVHAAAGGVGGLLCRMAAARGITVVGTVSRPEKADAARAAGAAHVVDYASGRFAEQVREFTGGRGVDAVFDAVGRDTFDEGLACLRPRGTFVLYGQTGGPAGPVDPQRLKAQGSVFLTHASLGHYDTDREAVLRRAAEVFRLVTEGTLRVRVHRAYPLEEAWAAHEDLESRGTAGKLLIRP